MILPKRHSKAIKQQKDHNPFEVSSHRWSAMPPARELGITSKQRIALVRIRHLYGIIADEISYSSVRDMEAMLAEAESLMERHFPEYLEELRQKRAAEPSFERTEEYAFAS